MSGALDIYLEIGKKRVFAGAVDWPGWCRSGRDEEAAQQALTDSASRYRRVMDRAGLEFPVSGERDTLVVVERLEGTSTTDFGAPGAAPSADESPVGAADLRRLQEILRACWDEFDAVVNSAGGKELRRGPRGGGRNLEGIVRHVAGAETGYLGALGFKLERQSEESIEMRALREAALEGLAASAAGDIPRRGPRGGRRWSPRYFVRRVAWHALDHAWEIEDRVLTGD